MTIFEKINNEIKELIKEYQGQPNCIILSSEYYHIIVDYIEDMIEGRECKFTKLYDLDLIVIDSKNFIKVTRRERI